jgi:hypothetical protein
MTTITNYSAAGFTFIHVFFHIISIANLAFNPFFHQITLPLKIPSRLANFYKNFQQGIVRESL